MGARAEVTVLDGLPEALRVGIFAQAGRFDAWVRWSNGGHGRAGDKKGDVRGCALKILGVPGKKLIPGLEDATTQDFLCIQTPTLGFATADDFAYFFFALQSPLTLLPKMMWHFGIGKGLGLLQAIAASVNKPVPSMATLRYWSAAPVRWGDHAAKISIVPQDAPPTTTASTDPAYLRHDLVARLNRGPVTLDLAVQLYVDAERTPIEDASVEWLEADSPFIPVARITIPRQDLTGAAGEAQCAYVEGLSFDPWHAPVEFRPLGNVMRARSPAYRVSTQNRKALPEPTELRDFGT